MYLFWTFHVKGTLQHAAFGVWLPCMMVSRFIHIAVCAWVSFLFVAKQKSTVWMDHILFVCSSTDGHLGLFHVLETVSRAALDLPVWGFV